MTSYRTLNASALLLGLVGLVGLVACAPQPPPAPPPPPAPAGPAGDAVSMVEPQARSAFVVPDTENAALPTPAVPEVKPEVGLTNVADRDRFGFLTDQQRSLLVRNGFLAVPSGDEQLHEVYRRNAEQGMAGFVTADTMLYAFVRLTEDTRRRFEAGLGPERLASITLALLDRCQAQVRKASGPELKQAAQMNVAYFAVAASLLGLQVDVDPTAAQQAKTEVAQITAHAGPASSALFPYQLDYSAFAAPAASGGSERLTRYRQAVTWYRIAPLATQRVDADGHLQPAWGVALRLALLLHAVATPPDSALRDVEALHDTLCFLDGDGPGLDVDEGLAAAEEVYGNLRSLRDFDDFERQRAFAEALAKRLPEADLAPPPFHSWPAGAQLRLLAQPEPPGKAVLAELAKAAADHEVGGLDLFAALGQPRAAGLMDQQYRRAARDPGYAAAVAALHGRLEGMEAASWQRDLVHGELWAAAPLSTPGEPGTPWFQRSAAWPDKELLTTLATWASGQHGLRAAAPGEQDLRVQHSSPKQPPPVYVEPVPDTFDRLYRLSRATTAGLEARGMLDEASAMAHDGFRQLVSVLRKVAVQELRNAPPNEEDKLALATFADDLGWLLLGLDKSVPAAEQGLPRITAVGPVTDSRQVYAGLGPVQVVYVVVPDGKGLRLTRGSMLSYHELRRPARPAFDDAAWRHELKAGTAVGQPAWAASFVMANPQMAHLALPTARPFGAP